MTANQKEAVALEGGATEMPRRTASTRVRTRCSPKRSREEAIQAHVEAAKLQIVRANVKKAKQGSLVHTKWLWGIAEKGQMESGNGHTSLAALLEEQLAVRGLRAAAASGDKTRES